MPGSIPGDSDLISLTWSPGIRNFEKLLRLFYCIAGTENHSSRPLLPFDKIIIIVSQLIFLSSSLEFAVFLIQWPVFKTCLKGLCWPQHTHWNRMYRALHHLSPAYFCKAIFHHNLSFPVFFCISQTELFAVHQMNCDILCLSLSALFLKKKKNSFTEE